MSSGPHDNQDALETASEISKSDALSLVSGRYVNDQTAINLHVADSRQGVPSLVDGLVNMTKDYFTGLVRFEIDDTGGRVGNRNGIFSFNVQCVVFGLSLIHIS